MNFPSRPNHPGAPIPPAQNVGISDSAAVPRKASVLPVAVGLLAAGISASLAVLDFLAVYPFSFNAFNIYGYALTPFVVFFCVAWDAAAQRTGRRDPWFDVRPGYSRILRVTALAALAIAVTHILELGRILGEWAVQAGAAL